MVIFHTPKIEYTLPCLFVLRDCYLRSCETMTYTRLLISFSQIGSTMSQDKSKAQKGARARKPGQTTEPKQGLPSRTACATITLTPSGITAACWGPAKRSGWCGLGRQALVSSSLLLSSNRERRGKLLAHTTSSDLEHPPAPLWLTKPPRPTHPTGPSPPRGHRVTSP